MYRLNLINSFFSKEINFVKTKIVVFQHNYLNNQFQNVGLIGSEKSFITKYTNREFLTVFSGLKESANKKFEKRVMNVTI